MLSRPADMPARVPFRSVTSRQNPIVSRFRQAARRSDPHDLVLIEGSTLVLEAAQAGWTLVSVAVVEDRLADRETSPLIRAMDKETDRIVVPQRVLTALSPATSPSGVVALARAPQRHQAVVQDDIPLAVIAQDVQDPGNVGALARAVEAAGGTELVVCGRSADPYGWKALRGSMGSAFRLPMARYETVVEAIAAAHARRERVLALTARHGESIYASDLRGPTAILVGGEGAGLPEEVAQRADTRVTIPMRPPVESLNVAVAAGVALYEARRQRDLE
jgi:TrmH family RNA methyltransferase